jgi:hypothetical protein
MYKKLFMFPLIFSLFFLCLNSAYSLQQDVNVVPSYGVINNVPNSDVDESRVLWWGVVSGSTAWGADFVTPSQIGLVADAGATSIRIMLDKNDWATNSVFGGQSYKDYIKTLVDSGHGRNLNVVLDLCRDSGTSWGADFDLKGKDEVITNSVKRQEWIEWGKDVISYCKPDAIGIMNEPRGGGTTFDYYYANFVLPSISAYKSAAQSVGISNFKIFVMPYPFSDAYRLAGTSIISDSSVIVELHLYYDPFITGHPDYVSACNSFYSGDIAAGVSFLNNYLNYKLEGLPLDKVNLAEVGVFRNSDHLWATDPSSEYGEWREFMNAVYDYAYTNGLHGLHQYQLAGNIYTILTPYTFDNYTTYGKIWADNVPT